MFIYLFKHSSCWFIDGSVEGFIIKYFVIWLFHGGAPYDYWVMYDICTSLRLGDTMQVLQHWLPGLGQRCQNKCVNRINLVCKYFCDINVAMVNVQN